MLNLKHIQEYPRWRVGVVALFSKLMGVCIHVEGVPLGSTRKRKPQTGKAMAGATNTGAHQAAAQATTFPG